MQTKQHIADATMATGGSMSLGSLFVYLLGWLDSHHTAVLAMCGIGGFCISLFGAYLGYKMFKINRKIKQLQIESMIIDNERKRNE